VLLNDSPLPTMSNSNLTFWNLKDPWIPSVVTEKNSLRALSSIGSGAISF
jgi:hypothetical protein